MSKLLEGKLALILGIANKWSLAYSIAQAFSREGATLALTYLGERQKEAIEELSADLNVAAILPCDVTRDEELAALTESLGALRRPLDAVVHSLAFANREDLTRPFLETGRAGFLLAQDVSAYSLVAVARATAPLMTDGGSLSTLTYVGSTRVLPGYNVMGVAKASLEAAMRYLASELGAREHPRERDFGGARQDRLGARHQGFLGHSGRRRRAARRCGATRNRRKLPMPRCFWPATWDAASPAIFCSWTRACK